MLLWCCDTVQLPEQGIRSILEGYTETRISVFSKLPCLGSRISLSSKVTDRNCSSSRDISTGKTQHQVEM